MLLGLEIFTTRGGSMIEASNNPKEVYDYIREILYGKSMPDNYEYPIIIGCLAAEQREIVSVSVAPLLEYSSREHLLTKEARLKWIQHEVLAPRY